MEKSPFTLFKEWLVSREDYDLEEGVFKAVNHFMALNMFGNLGRLTIFLNKHLNCYELSTLDKMQFFKYLKSLCKEFKLTFYDFSYSKFKHKEKVDESNEYFQFLKNYEVTYIINKMKESKEESNLETFGLLNTKSKKMTKKELSALEKDLPKKESKPKNKKEKIPETFSELKELLINNKELCDGTP